MQGTRVLYLQCQRHRVLQARARRFRQSVLPPSQARPAELSPALPPKLTRKCIPPDPNTASVCGRHGGRALPALRERTVGGREQPEHGLPLPPTRLVLTVEDVFGVAGPDLVVCVLVDEGSRHRGVTGHHVESTLGQHVKSPLQVLELEIKPGGVPFWSPVRVSAFIQTFSKNLFDQRNPSTNQNPWDPPEFCICLALPANSARPTVADGDESPLAVWR